MSGRIINTASEAGLFGNAGQANYGAAKAGIAAMTIVLGRELERYGVTVNAISPRARTRMTEDLFGDMAKAEEGKFDAFGPENVAPLVVFLASPEAADINGQNFVVYGGSVWVMQGWQPAGELKRDSRWTPKELPTTSPRSSRPTSRACLRSAPSEITRALLERARGAAQPRLGSTAVASPTTFTSPSALVRVHSRSTRWPASSTRLPVTTIFVDSSSPGQVWRLNRTW